MPVDVDPFDLEYDRRPTSHGCGSGHDGRVGQPGSSSRTACGPSLDLRPEPQSAPPLAHVHYGPWHVRVTLLVHADRVAMSQTQDHSDLVRVNELGWINSLGHSMRLHVVTSATVR